MADMMEFPDTVEEFMESCKIVDKDQVYSNGTEFVPIFRMKQWFDHMKGKWVDKEVFSFANDDHIVDEWQSARCSVCGKYHTTPYMYHFDNFNYCPTCGADMRGD